MAQEQDFGNFLMRSFSLFLLDFDWSISYLEIDRMFLLIATTTTTTITIH